MKQLILFLSIFAILSAHAEVACGLYTPANQIEGNVLDAQQAVERLVCIRDAQTPAQGQVEQAYIYAHLLTSWGKRKARLMRQVSRSLEPFGNRSAEMTPHACTNEGFETNIKQRLSRCGEAFLHVQGLFTQLGAGQELSPSMRSYFAFLGRALNGEVDEELFERATFDNEGRIQRSCEPSREEQRAEKMLRTPRNMLRYLSRMSDAGEAGFNPQTVIDQALSERMNQTFEARAFENADVFAEAQVFSHTKNEDRGAVARAYYADNNNGLGTIADRGCGGWGGTDNFLREASRVLDVPVPENPFTPRNEGRFDDPRKYGRHSLMVDLKLVQQIGGEHGCEHMRTLLRSYLSQNTALANAFILSRSEADITQRFGAAINAYEDQRRSVLDSIVELSNSRRVRQRLEASIAEPCEQLAEDFVGGFCEQDQIQENRHLVDAAYRQFGRQLCNRPSIMTADQFNGSGPMGYSFFAAGFDQQNNEGQRDSTCGANPSCDGAQYVTVEARWTCLNATATPARTPAAELIRALGRRTPPSSSGGPSGGGLGIGRGLQNLLANRSVSGQAAPAGRSLAEATGSVIGNISRAAIGGLAQAQPRPTTAQPLPTVPFVAPSVAHPTSSSEERLAAESVSDRPRRDRPDRRKRDRRFDEDYGDDYEEQDDTPRSIRNLSQTVPQAINQDGQSLAPAASSPPSVAPRAGVVSGTARPAASALSQGPVAPPVPPAVAAVTEPFSYPISAVGDALREANVSRVASGQPATPYLVAGVDIGDGSKTVSIPVPPAEITTVEAYQDYITERIDREQLVREGSILVQLGDGGTLWKVELVNGEIVVNPVPSPDVAVAHRARRFALDVLQNTLNQAQAPAR